MNKTEPSIAYAERALNVKLSERHVIALSDHADPIHEACDFLVLNSPYKLLSLVEVNRSLHAPDHPDPWPEFLVAFASNGCGDYFAIKVADGGHDTIVYIDPDMSVDENLASDDRSMDFATFDEWYRYTMAKS